MQPTAEDRRVLVLRKCPLPRHDVRLERERAANRRGQVTERLQAFPFLISRQKTAQLAERQCKQKVYGELRGERLRRRAADLDTRARQKYQLGLPHHPPPRDIADGQRLVLAA